MKRFYFFTAHLLLSSLLIFAGLEFAARCYYFFRAKEFRSNGILILTLTPYTMYGYEPNLRTKSLITNRLGFSEEKEIGAKTPGTLRAVLLGGSFPVSAEHFADCPAQKIQAALNHKYRGRVEFISAAFGGVNSYQEFIFLTLRVLKLNPDIIVVLDGRNDIREYNHPDFDELAPAHYRQISRYLSWSHGHRAAVEFAESSRLLTEIRRRMQARTSHKNADFFRQYGMLGRVHLNQQGPHIYQYNLQLIAQLCKANNIDLILAFQPMLPMIERRMSVEELAYLKTCGANSNAIDAMVEMAPRYLQAMVNVGNEHGFSVLDCNQLMAGQMNGQRMYVDDCHMTAEGSDTFAQIFTAAIAPKLDNFLRHGNKEAGRKIEGESVGKSR